ncbi:amidohydrolase family protein [Ramlibacter sp.]|uniref:amidohydrolase family protein n=1 Tax=Ramlibacter sp. TaxID=1917967 RepID=UPI003D15162A
MSAAAPGQDWHFWQSLDILNERHRYQPHEEILFPELRIVDAHHHIFDRADLPGQRYLFDDFLKDVYSGHNIVATVFAECSTMWRQGGDESLRPLGEIEFANGIAAMSASGRYGPARVNAGIIGFADLRMGNEVDRVLDAYQACAGSRLAGIRNRAQYEPRIGDVGTLVPSKDLMKNPSFRAGLKRLAARGLSYDSWHFHPQLRDFADLARAVPEARMVCCHFGAPLGVADFAGRRDEVFADWKRDMAELARCENVFVKLGGLGMPLSGLGFNNRVPPVGSEELARAWRPYIETCIELFGVDRCMFESNFPPDKQSCSYAVLWNTFKRITRDASAAERERLFLGTAKAVYRLDI